jgi:hypothetical protein
MDRPTPMDDERWRAEAFVAVHGDRQWMCVTANISADGSKLFALYERRFSGIRREVMLDGDRFRSSDERFAEIRRRLGIRPVDGGLEPAP